MSNTIVKCPHCNQEFELDNAGYAAILQQVHNTEFEKELNRRLQEAETANKMKMQLAVAEARNAAENNNGRHNNGVHNNSDVGRTCKGSFCTISGSTVSSIHICISKTEHCMTTFHISLIVVVVIIVVLI